MINIAEILRTNNIKYGFTLYSPLLEEVTLFSYDDDQIIVSKEINNHKYLFYFCNDGTFVDHMYSECLLFPDKRCNWSYFQQPKFNPKTLQPYDKVLVRDSKHEEWFTAFFSHIIYDFTEYDNCEEMDFLIAASCGAFSYCIPYNDETKHLVGTTKEAPEFYKYWE